MLILEQEDQERIVGLYTTYNEVVKPLLGEIEVRSNKIDQSLLNEIRAFNDHIARCYYDQPVDLINNSKERQREIKRQRKEIDKAEGHIRRLILDSFKQMNTFLSDKVKRFEKKMHHINPRKMGVGEEWATYRDLKLAAMKAVRAAKIEESKDTENAMKKFEESYQIYRKLEKLLDCQVEYVCKERKKAIGIFIGECCIWLFLVSLSALLSAWLTEFIKSLF